MVKHTNTRELGRGKTMDSERKKALICSWPKGIYGKLFIAFNFLFLSYPKKRHFLSDKLPMFGTSPGFSAVVVNLFAMCFGNAIIIFIKTMTWKERKKERKMQ